MVSIIPQIVLHPTVHEELEFSRSWYEEKARNLGVEFLDQVSFAIQKISEEPDLWPFYDQDKRIRRFLVHRFPYGIFYRYSVPIIQIVAVANLRRMPGYWLGRIQ